MRLKCLAGAYVGQIRDYSTAVGLAALRSGTAARLDAPARPATTAHGDTDASAARTNRQKHAAQRRERGQ